MSDRDLFRDWFGDGPKPDPIRSAQKNMRPALPKRFFKEAGVTERDGLFAVTLDGRVARTPGKTLLAVAAEPLAQAMAAEWQALKGEIDPRLLPITRIVNSAIDGVAREMTAVAAEIVTYSGTDLLCYRAGEPEELVRRQAEAWDPVLAWARSALGADFVSTSGIVHVAQAEEAKAGVAVALAGYDATSLAALSTVTTLTGSALLALAVARRHLEAEAAWAAAHVDEDYQIELWGSDEEAQLRRAGRWREMEAAARILRLSGA
jgi:chaperone required for assembly of F1-ATPase